MELIEILQTTNAMILLFLGILVSAYINKYLKRYCAENGKNKPPAQ